MTEEAEYDDGPLFDPFVDLGPNGDVRISQIVGVSPLKWGAGGTLIHLRGKKSLAVEGLPFDVARERVRAAHEVEKEGWVE